MRKPTVFAKLPVALFVVASAFASATHISEAHAQAAATAAKPPTSEQKANARLAYGAGESAFKAGDYPTARQKFTEANAIIPSIHAQYWIGLAFANEGNAAEAIPALTAVINSPDSSKLGAEKFDGAKAKLAEMEKMPASIDVQSTPPGAAVSLDGEAKGKTPVTVQAPPGAHKLVLSLDGYEPKTIELEVKPGEKTTKAPELMAIPPLPEPVAAAAPPPKEEPKAAAPPPPAKEERSLVPAYVTLGVAGASAIVGTIFGLQALSAKSDFDDNPTQDKADDADRNAIIADMAFGLTLTLGITGIVLLTSDDDADVAAKAPKLTRAARLDVAPYASPKGGGAAARLTF